MTSRREFITLLGGAAAWPLAARAQQGPRTRRIGVLMNFAENDPEGQARFATFVQRLKELGWIDGRNVHLDVRWAAGDADRSRRYATEFATLAVRSDLPKFASNNRDMGTPEENKAVVQGSITYFGTYSVNEADGALTLHIERCSFPNWNGTDQKRLISSLTAEELKYTNPAASIGGTAELTWKRVK